MRISEFESIWQRNLNIRQKKRKLGERRRLFIYTRTRAKSHLTSCLHCVACLSCCCSRLNERLCTSCCTFSRARCHHLRLLHLRPRLLARLELVQLCLRSCCSACRSMFAACSTSQLYGLRCVAAYRCLPVVFQRWSATSWAVECCSSWAFW